MRLLILSLIIPLSGCATATQQQVLNNLEGCTRVYKGAVQGGVLGAGFIGSVDIQCNPREVALAKRIAETPTPPN